MAKIDPDVSLSVDRYFSTLPTSIQRSIRQSGVAMESVAQMQRFVEHLNGEEIKKQD